MTQGMGSVCGQGLRLLLPVGQQPPLGRGDAARVHDLLAHRLIHGDGGGQMARRRCRARPAGPGPPGCGRPPRPWPWRPRNTRSARCADVQHVGADVAGALVPPAPLHRLQVRRRHLDLRVGAQAVRRVKQRLQVRRDLLQPQKQVHQDGPVAVLPAGPGTRRCPSPGTPPALWRCRLPIQRFSCQLPVPSLLTVLMSSHNHPILMFHSLAQSACEYNCQNRRRPPEKAAATPSGGLLVLPEDPAVRRASQKARRLSLQQRRRRRRASGPRPPG